jgi:nicotinamide mononucleotide transporter
MQYISEHSIEIIGSVLSLIYLYLSIKQKISLWIFGFLCSAMYVVVFYQSKFYADMSLQFYYVGVSVFGWISWRTGKQQTGKELPVKQTKKIQALVLSLITTVIFLLYYFHAIPTLPCLLLILSRQHLALPPPGCWPESLSSTGLYG